MLFNFYGNTNNSRKENVQLKSLALILEIAGVTTLFLEEKMYSLAILGVSEGELAFG